MLYWLHEIFDINLLGYITIRAGVAFFIALSMTLYLFPKFIRWAQKTSSVQPINSWAPQRHQGKVSTPTMGGVVFVGATIVASLFCVDLTSYYAIGALLTLLFFGFIGFYDDFAKIKKMKILQVLKREQSWLYRLVLRL